MNQNRQRQQPPARQPPPKQKQSLTPQQQSAHQQMSNTNKGVNMTAQQQYQLQQHQKMQIMQLHQRFKQQQGDAVGGGGDHSGVQQQPQQQHQQNDSWNIQMQKNSNMLLPSNTRTTNKSNNIQNCNKTQQMIAMENNASVGKQQQQQQRRPSQLQQMMQFQTQQEQMKQIQMQQAQQQQKSQSQLMQQHQQPQNQMMQQQQQQPQTQMVQQQQLQQIQQMQALEEQKRRYSMQLQQLQKQQTQQAQQQTSRPASASSHQSFQQAPQLISKSTSISSLGDRRPSYRMNTGTPLSPSAVPSSSAQPSSSHQPSSRPSSARPSSTQPVREGVVRPPSRPSSQFSQSSNHSLASQQNAPAFSDQSKSDFPPNHFSKPFPTSKDIKSPSLPQGESTPTSSVEHVAFDTKISACSQPTVSPNNMAPSNDQPTQSATTSTSGGIKHPNDQLKDKPPQSVSSEAKLHQATSTSSASKRTTPQRRNTVVYNSPLSYEEVAKLAHECTTEQKIVWVARQILGSGSANGFQKAASTMQRMKRQRARTHKLKDGGSFTKDEKSEEEERLKLETFNFRLAKRMHAEMKQGLQFCTLMTDVIRSILEDIDPLNAVLSVKPPLIGSDADFVSLPSSLPSVPVIENKAGKADSTAVMRKTSLGGTNFPTSPTATSLNAMLPKDKILRVPISPSAARKAKLGVNPEAETVADGNPNGSTLRKLRKRSSSTEPVTDPKLLKMVGDQDEGKKMSKKELSYRLFEATRFRTLEVGDYVAAKVASHELWVLGRVAKHWKAVGTYSQMVGLTEAKRDAWFKEKVYVQDNDEFNGDPEKARTVKRQHILPLPRSFREACDWGTRIRKGSRVYAMYPNTTALYSGSVIDSTTYCRNHDDIIVVQFDGDEDEQGIVPQRHIPARFVTLIPREFPASQNKKRRKPTATSDAIRKRASNVLLPNLPPYESSLDKLSVGIYGNSASGVPKKMNVDDMVFPSTPHSTPSPGNEPRLKLAPRRKPQTKRGSKRQKSDELASSHF